MQPHSDDPPRAGHLSVPLRVAQALRFFSRLPLPPLPGESDPYRAPDMAGIASVLPLAGALIGSVGAAAMALATGLLHLPSLAAGALTVTALTAATGAMHEDGLADTADGLGGGSTPARRLAIMSDSRIGAHGASALALSLILRTSLLAGLADRFSVLAALAVIAAAAMSRACAAIPLWLLPAAKAEGRAAAVGRPGDLAMARALAGAVAIALVLLAGLFGPAQTLAACGAAALVVLPLCALARRLVGGQTGDIAGAAQQLSEIAFLTILAARWTA